jgi:hypothetical protein
MLQYVSFPPPIAFSCLSHYTDCCWLNIPEIDSRQRFFFLAAASRAAVCPIQPPFQLIPETLSPEIKWLGCASDRSPPSVAKVKEGWSRVSTSSYNFTAWYLASPRDDFTFTSHTKSGLFCVHVLFLILGIS